MGVTLMRTLNDEKIVAIAKVDKNESEEEEVQIMDTDLTENESAVDKDESLNKLLERAEEDYDDNDEK